MSSTSIGNSGLLHPTDILRYPNRIADAVLVANTAQAFDIPPGAGIVSFGANVDFYVLYGSTGVSVPTTSSTASSTNGELNPTARSISGTTGLSLVSPSGGVVTMSFFTY
jgi:hypothetical protein